MPTLIPLILIALAAAGLLLLTWRRERRRAWRMPPMQPRRPEPPANDDDALTPRELGQSAASALRTAKHCAAQLERHASPGRPGEAEFWAYVSRETDRVLSLVDRLNRPLP